ncbi:protein FAM91A1 [Histomonas meleagridis]|uniref:protein FAM91A1 n=1 Tax=Histomonas meleagridis TaxID=135588 RepID=UPI0035597DBB|nr:protein FAM91A1 [Histomonas meleagridis]KAH0806204.1 protein FAM91A1 [Histomonas meleagridis]
MIQEEDTSKFLDEATPWEKLTPSAQAYFGTPAQYQQRILNFFFDHQKPYGNSLPFIQKQQYYQRLIDYGINNFLVFPYHLTAELRENNPIVPFNYYCEMLLKVMASDRSYQSIPNFSAADALRVTGVGRNQFIDAMNKSRTNSWSSFIKSKDKVLRSLLPQAPMEVPLQKWWILITIPASDSKLNKLPSSQRLTYERIASQPNGAEISSFNEQDIRGLINEGLIYINIPLTQQDTVKLLPLDNFVMNRVCGDYLEGLCYKSFISIDERTTIEQLSKMLAVEVHEIRKVLSLFIRLGLAERVSIDEQADGGSNEPTAKRLAAIYDCNLPAALMLGNLGQTVKSFSVTLFEVGKMLDASVSEFIEALQQIDPPADESMVSCHEKCQVIARIGLFLKSQPIAAGGLDLLRLENLLDLDEDSRAKMFERNYTAAIALAPLMLTQSSLSIPGLVHFGPPSPLFHSPWALLYLHSVVKQGPPVFVWPQGEIVTSLPEPFFEYDTVRLYRWGAEAVVVPTTTLLISLNDALPSSPVLVQCYEKEGETMKDVGFPLEEQMDEELQKAFALDTMFGFMKLVTTKDGKNIPIDILYGIPTTSLQLCDQVIKQIEARNMLGEENIQKLQEETKRITGAMEEFVKTWSCGIGHPVRSIVAVDGNLQWI